MNRSKNNTFGSKATYFRLFIMIESVIVTAFLIYDIIKHGSPLNSVMLSDDCQFNDYFMHIGYASAPWGTNIYDFSINACFPPLAYLMYGLLARVAGYAAEDPTDIPSHKFVGNNLTIYLIFSIVCIILLVYAVSLYVKKKGVINQVVFPCLLVFSYPFAFSSLQRGNSVLLVAVLMSIAVAWKDDSSKVKREFALIIIAVCAGLKIYPAVIGLLYLKEKRFKEAVRLVIYGIVFFFVPFIFFGGIDGFRSFLKTILSLNGEIHRCSISGFVERLTIRLFGTAVPVLNVVIQQSFLLISVAAVFLCKEKWGEVLILCSVMAVYVSSGWMYTCIYILPALLMFFKEKGDLRLRISKKSIIEIIGFILFLITFSIPYKVSYSFIYDSIIVLDSFFILIVFISFIAEKSKRKPVMTD